MNRVILTGRITRDPEIRYTQSGIASVSFSIAVDRNYSDASGNRQADFINCVAWRNNAEFISRYVKKGYMLCVEGRIQTRNYQGNDGQTHYVTEVLCDSVENMTPRQNTQVNPGYQQPGERPSFQQPTYQQPSYQQPSYGSEPNYGNNANVVNMDVDDDDLPF